MINNKPCIKCGSTERYESGDCKMCARRRARCYQAQHGKELTEYKRKWRQQDYAKNPEKYRQYKRKYRLENLEKVKQQAARWYNKYGREYHRTWNARNREQCREAYRNWKKANPDIAKAATQRWRQNNPDKVRAQLQRRRARRKGASGTHTAKDCVQRSAYYGDLCWVCREAPMEAIDHFIALCNGGSDWPANLYPICARCNGSKGAWESRGHKSIKEITEWVQCFRQDHRLNI